MKPVRAAEHVGDGVIPEEMFGERLRKARRHAGLNQATLASALGVPVGRLGAWESGASSPRSRDLVDIAKAMRSITGVSATWLLGLPAPPPTGGRLLKAV